MLLLITIITIVINNNKGMPVGPITLCDEVGIDISYHVSSFMSKADLGIRMAGGDASLMAKMVVMI